MIERCFKTKSVMKTNRNQFIILVQPIEWCFIKAIYVCQKKSFIIWVKQRTDNKSPYFDSFDSTLSAQAALILWRRVICTCPKVQISFICTKKSVHVVKKEAVWKHGIKTFASWNLDRSGGFNPDLGLIGTHFDGTNCTLIHTFYVLSSIVYFSLFKKRGFFFFSFYFSLFPVACLSCWEGKGVCFWMHGVGEPVCG